MATMTESSTDKRVDDLRSEMHRGFDQVDQRLAALDAKFDSKFDSLNRTIVYLLGGSLSVLVGGLLAAVLHPFS